MMPRATLPFLLICSTFSAAHGEPASDALAGHWRGAYGSGPAETVIELQFDPGASGYRGHFWSAVPAGTSLPVTAVDVGPSIRFAVPPLGIFEGDLHGDVLEGKFSGERLSGPFKLRKEPTPDDFRFVD